MTETRHTGKSPENAKPEGTAGRPERDLTALLPEGAVLPGPFGMRNV